MTHDEAVRNVRELAAQLDGRVHGAVATPAQLRYVADMAEAAKGMEVALRNAYDAMRDPHGEWHDLLENAALPIVRAALAAMPKVPE